MSALRKFASAVVADFRAMESARARYHGEGQSLAALPKALVTRIGAPRHRQNEPRQGLEQKPGDDALRIHGVCCSFDTAGRTYSSWPRDASVGHKPRMNNAGKRRARGESSAIPIIAIVGRPNVGKSTLFNRLTESRHAIVEDQPGVTRDRQYGEADIMGRRVIVVDTGGIEPLADDVLYKQMREQAEIAIEESDAILCVLDGPAGVLPQDAEIVQMLRVSKKPVFWVINKIDGPRHDALVADFYELGIHPLFPVSAQHAGGTLNIESKPDGGTTVTLTSPTTRATSAASGSSAAVPGSTGPR